MSEINLKSFPALSSLVPTKIFKESYRTTVLLTNDSRSNVQYVVKVGSETILKHEVECLGAVKHPNIETLHHVCCRYGYYALKLEYVRGITLSKYLLQKGVLDCSLISQTILPQLLDVVDYLHNNGWVHRDIKPDNIIFNEETNVIKLIDFELSSKWSKWWKLTDFVGTLEYSPPEIRNKHKYFGPEVDLWSLGVTLFVLLFSEFPFTIQELNQSASTIEDEIEEQQKEQQQQQKQKKEELKKSKKVPRYEEKVMKLKDVRIQTIIIGLLEYNTKKRMPLSQVRNILFPSQGKLSSTPKVNAHSA